MDSAGASLLAPDKPDFTMDFYKKLSVESPQPILRGLMDENRALRSDKHVLFLRLADIIEATRHKDALATDGNTFSLGARRPLIPLHLDGTKHRDYRRLLDPLLSLKRMMELEPRIRAVIVQLLDELVLKRDVEFFSEFCEQFPGRVFLDLLGLPREDLPFFMKFKNEVIRPQGATLAERNVYARRVGEAMYVYLDKKIGEMLRNPPKQDNLIASFLAFEVDGQRLSPDELSDIMYLFVVAGLDTVTASTSCLTSWLARHSAEQDWLRSDRTRIPVAIEELMRYEAPVPMGSRYASKDLEVNGIEIGKGMRLGTCWAAACLDESAFANPLAVDLSRSPNRHIAFASGFHRCLGMHLARVELNSAFDELLARTRNFKITPGATPVYNALGVRTVLKLPLTLESAQ